MTISLSLSLINTPTFISSGSQPPKSSPSRQHKIPATHHNSRAARWTPPRSNTRTTATHCNGRPCHHMAGPRASTSSPHRRAMAKSTTAQGIPIHTQRTASSCSQLTNHYYYPYKTTTLIRPADQCSTHYQLQYRKHTGGTSVITKIHTLHKNQSTRYTSFPNNKNEIEFIVDPCTKRIPPQSQGPPSLHVTPLSHVQYRQADADTPAPHP